MAAAGVGMEPALVLHCLYVDKQKVDASYKNGVLELSLTKSGEPKKRARQIEIKG